ncbi:MAG: hypothetical protein H7301_13490 [Cryobacterium sp.]|nr:hypothetical protein [Oligoflexia bacterium]
MKISLGLILFFVSLSSFAGTDDCLKKAIEAGKSVVHLNDPAGESRYTTTVIDISPLPVDALTGLSASAEYRFAVLSKKTLASESDPDESFSTIVRIQSSDDLHRCIVLESRVNLQRW